MKKILYVFLLACFIGAGATLNANNEQEIEIKENSIILIFKEDTKANKELENTLEKIIEEDIKDIEVLDNNKTSIGDVIEIETENDVDVESAIKELEKEEDIEYAQPNYIYKVVDYSASDSCSNAWHLTPNYLNAAAAKAKLAGKSNINVGIVDTGVNPNHEQFSGIFNSNLSYDFVRKQKAQVDGHNHGTHVAGTVAGKTVGTGTKINIVSYRVLDNKGAGYTSDIIKAINKANSDGVGVLNMSLGGYHNDKLLYNAIAKYNGIVVAAAGNEGYNTAAYPARYNLDNIISVGWMTRDKNRAKYSNYNSSNVDLYTYGVDIYSSTKASNTSYACYQGSSMATPSVSASVAMNKSYNSSASNQQLKAAVMDGTVAKSSLTNLAASNGYLDLNRSLTIIGNTNSNVANPRKAASHSATLSSTTFILNGLNDYGQLGNSANKPFSASQISKYYLTRKNTYVITKSGKLYVAGANDKGQLGNASLGNTNRFVEFPKVSSSHKIVGLDFRNAKGMYDENSIYIYLKYGKNAQYYKLGTNSFKLNSTKKTTYNKIQFVTYENNRKKAIYYYNGNRKVSAKELYKYNGTTGDIDQKAIYSYKSSYNRKLVYKYNNGKIKKYAKSDKTKSGKNISYEVKTYKVYRKATDVGYTYYSLKSSHEKRSYKKGVITSKKKLKYNKYGKLAYKNKSNAKYSYTTYKKGLAVKNITYKYNAKGKKLASYKRVNTYSKKKLKTKKEYFYNKKGKLKKGAYYYKTTYKKGKAKKTYRYEYNNSGKLMNKKAVKTRK